jgi:hypothetical protein
MKTRNLAATLMAFGFLVAAPAFAQTTTPVQKQPTQEGGPSMPTSSDPNFKQRTQEGGPSAPGNCGAAFNASGTTDPNCKHH